MRRPIDDKTAAYILEMQPHFADLRQVAAQLAGVLLLAAVRSKSAASDRPTLEAAARLFAATAAGVRSAAVTARARAHHRHLTQAAEAIGAAIESARHHLRRPRADIDPVLVALRAGHAHLQRASNQLPGFEMVAFEHACCAVQTRSPQSTRRPQENLSLRSLRPPRLP
jgi:hypothetical protein